MATRKTLEWIRIFEGTAGFLDMIKTNKKTQISLTASGRKV